MMIKIQEGLYAFLWENSRENNWKKGQKKL